VLFTGILEFHAGIFGPLAGDETRIMSRNDDLRERVKDRSEMTSLGWMLIKLRLFAGENKGRPSGIVSSRQFLQQRAQVKTGRTSVMIDSRSRAVSDYPRRWWQGRPPTK